MKTARPLLVIPFPDQSLHLAQIEMIAQDGDDSGIVISEEGVTKMFAGQIVGYQFDPETSAAVREFFETLYNS